MNQEQRRELQGSIQHAIGLAHSLHATTIEAGRATRFSIQRATILPGLDGHPPRFRIGTAGGNGNGPAEVRAASTIDVYLEHGEPCPDCGGAIEPAADHGPEYGPGDLVCRSCGSLYSDDSERWLEWAQETYCTECREAVETWDGGPELCFRCREAAGVRTICSGCGRPYEAPAAERPRMEGRARANSPWSRLCDRCDHPATARTTRPTPEAKARYHAVASVYGTPEQVAQALETAAALQVPGVPTNLQAYPELWSGTQIEAATAWLQGNLSE